MHTVRLTVAVIVIAHLNTVRLNYIVAVIVIAQQYLFLTFTV